MARCLRRISDDHIDDDVLGCGAGLLLARFWLAGWGICQLLLGVCLRSRCWPRAAGHSLQGACIALLHERVIVEGWMAGTHALRHWRMLLRHPLLAHVDDGVDVVLDMADGVDMPLVADRARHLP